jgi:hypothetical protein
MHVLLVAGTLVFARGTSGWGQDAPVDPRWLAFLGCWESSTVAQLQVCVVPAAGTSAVDLVTVADGQIATRERITATGERVASAPDGCPGWESAEWSPEGQRVYLRGESECSGGARRSASGLIAMSPNGEWLHVQSVTVGGGQTGVRVLRYREASAGLRLPADVAAPPPGGVWAVSRARAAAGARLTEADVIEVSRHVDATVLEAWLAERQEQIGLDAKRLLALADAGVPDRVIDLMVAMAYPAAFSKTVAARPEPAAPQGGSTFDPFCFDYLYGCPGLMYDPYSAFSPYSYGYRGGRGGGYGGGWYNGGYPVIIVYQGTGGAARSHGRVVNGRGYSAGEMPGTAQAGARPHIGSSQPSGGSAGSGSSGGSSRSGSSSGSGEQRTAKPRPH